MSRNDEDIASLLLSVDRVKRFVELERQGVHDGIVKAVDLLQRALDPQVSEVEAMLLMAAAGRFRFNNSSGGPH